MKSTAALMWKEWRQQRWLAISGLLVFFGCPLADATYMKIISGKFVMYGVAGELSLWFGGLFAIIYGVSLTAGDLKNGCLTFWRSRPVGLWKWLAVKYLLGLTIVMVVVSAAPVVQATMNKEWTTQSPYTMPMEPVNVLSCHSWTVMLLFSIAFCCGAFVRRGVYATILAIAAALIVYFGPVLVPPLAGFSVLGLLRQWPLRIVHPSTLGHGGPWFAYRLRLLRIPMAQDLAARINIDVVGYAAAALVLSALLAVFAGWAVKNNRQVRVGRKPMFWMLAVVALMLLSVVAFKLGSNLACERLVKLFPGSKRRPYVVAAACEGEKGVLLERQYNGADSAYTWSLQRFDLSASQAVSGKPAEIPEACHPSIMGRGAHKAMIPAGPDLDTLYTVHAEYTRSETPETSQLACLELLTMKLGPQAQPQVVGRVDLMDLAKPKKANVANICRHGQRLYCYINGPDLLAVFDISGNGLPKLLATFSGPFGMRSESGGRWLDGRIRITKTIRLIPSAGLTDEERLKITISLACYEVCDCQGKTYVEVNRDFMRVFQLSKVQGDLATLVMTANRNCSQLERLTEMYPSQVLIHKGLAYVLCGDGGAGLTVFDLRKAGDIQRIGHYAAPTERFAVMEVLADGNILLAGRDLHIVGSRKVR